MKITEIYTEYKIFPLLQKHMLRVAAVAKMICDNSDLKLDANKIVTTCLLHDMGNIIKADLKYFKDLENELSYWESVKGDFIQKYGANEHVATMKIIKEIGVGNGIPELSDANRFSLICKNKDSSDVEIKIIHYADGRVGPYGVLSYQERMEEAGKRYAGRGRSEFEEEERLKLVNCGKEIEDQIFSHCKIKPEDITDEAIAPLIEELKEFVITP